MQIAAFYHLWVDGEWEVPLAEFLQALWASQYVGSLHISVVGSSEGRERAQFLLNECQCRYALYYAEQGFEATTLSHLRTYVENHDGAVLYAHAKGSHHQDVVSDDWRRTMTEHVVRKWRANLLALEDHDVVGWAWVDERVDWEMPAFIGNFWMARCDYVRTIPMLTTYERGEAETWIGRGNPSVLEREEWNRDEGPSALRPCWHLLRQRWRWFAEGMPENFPPPPDVDEGEWNKLLNRLRVDVAEITAAKAKCPT